MSLDIMFSETAPILEEVIESYVHNISTNKIIVNTD